jgi:hypothetical protein
MPVVVFRTLTVLSVFGKAEGAKWWAFLNAFWRDRLAHRSVLTNGRTLGRTIASNQPKADMP